MFVDMVFDLSKVWKCGVWGIFFTLFFLYSIDKQVWLQLQVTETRQEEFEMQN